MSRKQATLALIIPGIILLFLAGYYNKKIVEFYYNGEFLLGFCYVIILFLCLVIYKINGRLNYLRGRNSELEDKYYNKKMEYYKVSDQLNKLKARKTSKKRK